MRLSEPHSVAKGLHCLLRFYILQCAGAQGKPAVADLWASVQLQLLIKSYFELHCVGSCSGNLTAEKDESPEGPGKELETPPDTVM